MNANKVTIKSYYFTVDNDVEAEKLQNNIDTTLITAKLLGYNIEYTVATRKNYSRISIFMEKSEFEWHSIKFTSSKNSNKLSNIHVSGWNDDDNQSYFCSAKYLEEDIHNPIEKLKNSL